MSLKFSTHLIILKRSTPSVSKYRHSQSHSQSHILYTPSHRISTLSIRLKISTLSKCLYSRPFSKYVYRQYKISTLSISLKLSTFSVSISLHSRPFSKYVHSQSQNLYPHSLATFAHPDLA